jgi:hypothetical protein
MSPSSAPALSPVASLIYELLDAHQDTVRLTDRGAGPLDWQAHLDYLRALQRVARERLAAIDAATTSRQPANRGSDDCI